MKRIRIFKKEFYIFDEKEHHDLVDSYCGIKAGIDNAKWNLNLVKQYREENAKFDFCAQGVEQSIEFAERHAVKFNKVIDLLKTYYLKES